MYLKIKTLTTNQDNKPVIEDEIIKLEIVSDCLRIATKGKVRDIKIKDIKQIIGEQK